MPPDASSEPEIGLNRTDTSTSPWGPPGARITLNLLFVARWTSARPSREAPATSSRPHAPEMISHPSNSLVKSDRGAADPARLKVVLLLRVGLDSCFRFSYVRSH